MIFRVVPVAEDFDLNNVCRGDGYLFVRDGIGFAGREIAHRLTEREVESFLEQLVASSHNLAEHQDVLPIVFGLIPFSPTVQGQFVLTQVTFLKRPDGSQFVIVLGGNEDDLADEKIEALIQSALSSQPPRPTSNSFRISPKTPIGQYLDTVVAARDAVRSGALRKVVIARDIEIHADDPIDVHAILLRLRATFGSSYRYCVDNMIGASPELLIEVDGRTVRSHPLAGTAPRTGDSDTDARLAAQLIASTKDQLEHRVVIDMVHDTLLPHCSYLDWEAEPSIVTVANVQHLGTAIEGALTDPPTRVLQLVRELCPTPALGGFPGREAIDFINTTENIERGNYGGAVGWMNSAGNGTFAVTIRCAELSTDRRTARLFAGGGIVGESDPYSELAETQAKFQAMMSAIIRP
jgi:isochorismate synthase